MSLDDEYLWTGEGRSDPDVARLEQLLEPLGARRDLPPPRRARRPHLWFATLLAAAAVLVLLRLRMGDGAAGDWGLFHAGRGLAVGERFVAETGSLLELRRLGTLELAPGSELRVDSLAQDEIVLRLERGAMTAFVSADAQPGLFNVDTPATRCVDLGCAYDLTVQADGLTRVEVTLGRVAFRDAEREVFVPAGAVCLAAPGRGAGTPHFIGASATFAKALEEYDASEARETRQRLGLELCGLASERTDALPLWHLTQSDDGTVALAAARRLEALVGAPAGVDSDSGAPPTAEQRAAWREFLWPDPYR